MVMIVILVVILTVTVTMKVGPLTLIFAQHIPESHAETIPI